MSRNLSPVDIADRGEGAMDPAHTSIRDRFPLKRSSNSYGSHLPHLGRRRAGRSHSLRLSRKIFKSAALLYLIAIFAFVAFIVASVVLQSSITSILSGGRDIGGLLHRELSFGTSLKFFPARRFVKNENLDQLRTEARIALRPPRLAVIIGSLNGGPQLLMLCTLVKNMQELGYKQVIYALEEGDAHSVFRQMGYPVSIIKSGRVNHIDWKLFEGAIVTSLEAWDAISSFMQEPFCSVPLIWIIEEGTLGNRLPYYGEMRWNRLISFWRNAFNRADVVVFPDYSLPMLYAPLDGGNFFVVSGSPADAWIAGNFMQTHSKHQLRKDEGFSKNDVLILVVGSSFVFSELSWDYAVAMHSLGPLLVKYTRRNNGPSPFHFLFLCGNSPEKIEKTLQEVSQNLGLPDGSMRHYNMDHAVNNMLLMADIVLYASSQEEQGFPPLLSRAMSFGIPVVAPDFPVVKKYIVDGVHGIIYEKHNPDALTRAFSHLISNGKLSKFSHIVSSSGRLLAKNMLASDCITGYARLLENILDFPSDVHLPLPVSHLNHVAWEWNLFHKGTENRSYNLSYIRSTKYTNSSIIVTLEKKFASPEDMENVNLNETEIVAMESLASLDWDVILDMENYEDHRRREMEEIDERMERNVGTWDDIYQNARKAERAKFERNERDEGELERIGHSLCIYEIYDGAGSWPFLHHGSLYRGLSLSRNDRRLTSDDIDAVGRLPLLNDSYYKDFLCEIGAMFSIANKVDDVHKRPWIGFQSWHAAGRKLSLSTYAEKALEEAIRHDRDVIYFWVKLDAILGTTQSNDALTFWSLCDVLNSARCRTVFEDAFRSMYMVPSGVDALPPMPDDGGHWSALHSWVMPTPSFLEFIMFSRMFVDSLDSLHVKTSNTTTCLLGSSRIEVKHCYCRVIELLVNVWVYHSGRKMIYVDPHTGSLKEQHPVEGRESFAWGRYFDSVLLKGMDEDLAEAADDGDYPDPAWLWPRTGEVQWRGMYEREREERYRQKMDKKRKTKEKLLDRMRYGYKQKSLSG